MTSQVYSWPRVYELSVDELHLYWEGKKREFPYLSYEYEFFIDLIPILREIWSILTQKRQGAGRHPKSRPSQFFFTLRIVFFKRSFM